MRRANSAKIYSNAPARIFHALKNKSRVELLVSSSRLKSWSSAGQRDYVKSRHDGSLLRILLHQLNLLLSQPVEPIDDLVNELVGERDLSFEGQQLVFGFLKTGADLFIVCLREPNFLCSKYSSIPAQVSEEIDGCELPELVQFRFGIQRAGINIVEVFEIGEEVTSRRFRKR